MKKPTTASGNKQGRTGDADTPDIFKDEMPGWIWILTVNEEPHGVIFEQDEVGEDILGCYATRDLLRANAKRMNLGKFNVHHMKVEGWSETKQRRE